MIVLPIRCLFLTSIGCFLVRLLVLTKRAPLLFRVDSFLRAYVGIPTSDDEVKNCGIATGSGTYPVIVSPCQLTNSYRLIRRCWSSSTVLETALVELLSCHALAQTILYGPAFLLLPTAPVVRVLPGIPWLSNISVGCSRVGP